MSSLIITGLGWNNQGNLPGYHVSKSSRKSNKIATVIPFWDFQSLH